jgi:putative ABC transport system permease protein
VRRVPLAWHNLTHDLTRFVLFVAGIGFAVVLMFVQNGFRHALLDSNVLLIDALDADLLLTSCRGGTVAQPETYSRHRLLLAASVSGVRSVHPLYVEYNASVLRDPAAQADRRGPGRPIRVLGLDPHARLLRLPELDPDSPASRVADLALPGNALYDRRAKRSLADRSLSVFGPLADGLDTDLAGRNLHLAGGFDLGTDFTADGTLLVSEDTFAAFLRPPPLHAHGLDRVQIGLIRLDPNADRRRVQSDLQALYAGQELDVLTPAQLADREKDYWLHCTPIGFVFGFGMMMGFVVGLVICYQILSSDVTDHLPEYATLRAIGYPGRYLGVVVLQEALLLALAGFLPGLLVSAALYGYLGRVTGLPLRLLPGRVGLVFVLTLVMCAASGWLALRKAREVDPAEVF